MSKINEIGIEVNFFRLLSWECLASASSSIRGLNSSVEINLSVACKCSSVTRDLRKDFFAFIDEKSCSHT